MYDENAVNHRALMLRMMMACLAVAMMSVSSQAQRFYDFIEGGTGDVLATLELSSIPATHTEVVELTFTPAGETLFGYSSPYTGIFDGNDGPFVDDGTGGLDGGVQYEGVLWDGWKRPGIVSPIICWHQLGGTDRIGRRRQDRGLGGAVAVGWNRDRVRGVASGA